ncbi:unnamed protein product [Phaeothamnion confervicola]
MMSSKRAFHEAFKRNPYANLSALAKPRKVDALAPSASDSPLLVAVGEAEGPASTPVQGLYANTSGAASKVSGEAAGAARQEPSILPLELEAPTEAALTVSSGTAEGTLTGDVADHVPHGEAAASTPDAGEADDNVPDGEANASAPSGPIGTFTACETFSGAWPGHVFKLGDRGVGYYEDCQAPLPPPPRTVDVAEALGKLRKPLQSTRKLPKAAKLMRALMDAELTPGTALQFFAVLEATLATRTGITAMAAATAEVAAPRSSAAAGGASTARGAGSTMAEAAAAMERDAAHAAVASVVAGAWQRRDCFSAAQQVKINAWRLRLLSVPQLRTDDSWSFAAACRALGADIEALSATITSGAGGDAVDAGSPARALLEATVACMRLAFSRYHHAWAQQPVDAAFQKASDRRLLFPPNLRETVDDFTTRIHERRRRPAGFSQHTVRAIESTAHPLRNRKGDIIP